MKDIWRETYHTANNLIPGYKKGLQQEKMQLTLLSSKKPRTLSGPDR